MLDLTFGEQVKLVLSRKGMTIKELAELIEARTGKKMSRQNLTQRLGRDNFQEQDMRMIASILECPFRLSILEEDTERTSEESVIQAAISDEPEKEAVIKMEPKTVTEVETAEEIEPKEIAANESESELEREVTVGEFLDIREESDEPAETEEEKQERLIKELLEEMDAIERESQERSREREERTEQHEKTEKKSGWLSRFRRKGDMTEVTAPAPQEMEEPEEFFDEADEEVESEEIGIIDIADEPDEEETADIIETTEEKEESSIAEKLAEVIDEDEEDLTIGDVNPYTGREYATNSVRMHPKRIGYVQVYDRKEHKWTDMTEWAFLGYQERKKVLLGKDYEPPIYLD